MTTPKQSSAQTDEPKAPCPNIAFSGDAGMSMDPTRAQKLFRLYDKLNRQVHSLKAATSAFQHRDLDQGEMDPAITVTAFAREMDYILKQMWDMFENQEQKENAQ